MRVVYALFHARPWEMRLLAASFLGQFTPTRSDALVRYPVLFAATLSLIACGGGDATSGSAASVLAAGSATGEGAGAPVQRTAGPTLRGDGSKMLAWGGWAWGDVPAAAIVRAGFDWFETGYPGDATANQILLDAKVRPFAYVNLGELHDDLKAASAYTGPILRTNAGWGTSLVDVTDQSWQEWLVRRADDAYRTGSRGIKWDVAQPDVPPGKNRGDVNNAIAAVMQRILDQHPDMKFVFNQGFEFALAYPQYVAGLEMEGVFSAVGAATGYLQPWNDPYYWGPLYKQAKQVQALGIPVINAEYEDPSSARAHELYDAMTKEGFIPYITNERWDVRGWGYGVAPGW